MIERDIEIMTEDGTMPTFYVHPKGGENFPAVIFYMDASGIREELRNMCRRIAEQGYFVLLPDLYYRLGLIRFDPEKRDENRDEGTMKVVSAARFSINNACIMRDTRSMLRYLDGEPLVSSGPKGCIGYCMSGQYILSATGTFPGQFSAGASLYGLQLVTDQPDSPHLLTSKVKAELYFGFAETDHQVPENVIPDLKAGFDKYGIAYTIDVHPGTHHGFCFPERSIYHKEAAEEVWRKVFYLFKKRLSQQVAS